MNSRPTSGYPSFLEEIWVEAAKIRPNQYIIPDYVCENDSEPVGFADTFIKQLYTLWQRAERASDELGHRRERLLWRLKEVPDRKLRGKIYQQICALDAPIIAKANEAMAHEAIFKVESYRRIPDLYRIDMPMLASDWGFYGETVLLELPAEWSQPAPAELEVKFLH